MMHERGTSDPVIVAMKLTNKAEQSAAEAVERRAGTKGNVNQQSTSRTPSRISVTQALERMRQDLPPIPEVGAVSAKAARTDLCGGRSAMSVPTATASLAMTEFVDRWSPPAAYRTRRRAIRAQSLRSYRYDFDTICQPSASFIATR